AHAGAAACPAAGSPSSAPENHEPDPPSSPLQHRRFDARILGHHRPALGQPGLHATGDIAGLEAVGVEERGGLLRPAPGAADHVDRLVLGELGQLAQPRGLTDDGVTVLLTTQYLEEADQLADDIVV